MTAKFDLIEAPWIPCLDGNGQLVELGLRQTLAHSHELTALGGESPLVNAALYRLLLVVLHRVFGPEGYDAWGALWQAQQWDAASLDAYLARWRERFDLFGAVYPFYQVADTRVKPKSVSSMIHDVASGNNATLFDHHTDEDALSLTPAQAARLLVAAQSFGLAGLSGLLQKFTDGTCARGITFLVEGDNLFETLALNCLSFGADDGPLPQRPDDRPAWEMDDPFLPDRSLPRGYLDYLTWQNRRILLLPDESTGTTTVSKFTMAPGLRLDATVTDPMKHYRKDEKLGALPLRFSEERALWRDSSALFQSGVKAYQPPQVFAWLAGLISDGQLSPAQTRRTLALGMANNQAKVELYRSERLPLPLRYLREPDLVNELTGALQMAEAAGQQLWGAARKLATLLLSPEADAEEGRQPVREDLDQVMGPWGVERRYWSRLEVPFHMVVETLPRDHDAALAAWQEVLRRTAWEAFEGAAADAGIDGRALKAVVRARDQLAVGLAKALPK